MKIYTLLFLSCTFSLPFGAEKKIDSSIKEVTVYLAGAQIKRTATVHLIPGTNEIILHDLSSNIDENSIQISGLQNTSILSLNFAINYLEKKKDSEKILFLKTKLKTLLKEKNTLDNTITGLQQEQKLLNNNQKIGSDITPISLENIKEISAYYRERSIIIDNNILCLSLCFPITWYL
ncbi:DUF4140 domain-containing protein [Aquimarina sp. I32.4]|uniref:DUF4140 domain-containing protein n=1 Tax=Aquimarina sp. I32.4 TaxID=2053903 RepID=UPI000CDEE902|nr:DUF4140 domain-containing protein [Aquimarina sp. I32.4]